MNAQEKQSMIKVLAASLRTIGLTIDDVLIVANHLNNSQEPIKEEVDGDNEE